MEGYLCGQWGCYSMETPVVLISVFYVTQSIESTAYGNLTLALHYTLSKLARLTRHLEYWSSQSKGRRPVPVTGKQNLPPALRLPTSDSHAQGMAIRCTSARFRSHLRMIAHSADASASSEKTSSHWKTQMQVQQG